MAGKLVPLRAPEPDRNTMTKKALRASWEAAQRRGDIDGCVQMNEAACAGMLLHHADGDPAIAMTMLPETRGGFWSRVCGYLDIVRKDGG